MSFVEHVIGEEKYECVMVNISIILSRIFVGIVCWVGFLFLF